MTRILQELPWQKIITDTLDELAEEAQSHPEINQFNVEDEFDPEDVLLVLIDQIQRHRPNLPRHAASNMVSQLFRGGTYVNTPKGPRPLSKTARREHVADRILRQLAIQLGADDPEFDITAVLKLNYSLRADEPVDLEPIDDGLTQAQRFFRGFGTDDMEQILPAFQEVYGTEIRQDVVLRRLFSELQEKAFFYSPIMFLTDLERLSKSLLQESLTAFVLGKHYNVLNPVDQACLLLEAHISGVDKGKVFSNEQWHELLSQTSQRSQRIKLGLKVDPDNHLRGVAILEKPAHRPKGSQTKVVKAPNLEDQLGVEDIGDLVTWLQWAFEDEIATQDGLRRLMNELIGIDQDRLTLAIAFERIRTAAAKVLQMSPERLREVYRSNFSTKVAHIELAFYMSALTEGTQLMVDRPERLRSRIQDVTFNTLLRLSDAAHEYKSEARKVERMLVVDEQTIVQDVESYDLTTDEMSIVRPQFLIPNFVMNSVVQSFCSRPVLLSRLSKQSAKRQSVVPTAAGDAFIQSQMRYSMESSFRRAAEVRMDVPSMGFKPVMGHNFLRAGMLGR